MTNLNGKLFFITGAGDGIGKQTALLAARKGAQVIATDIHADSAMATAAEISATGQKAHGYGLDVTDREGFFELADKVRAQHGPVDILMNNAGVTVYASADKMTQEELDWVMGINFFGTVTGCNAFLPQMMEQGSGHIINVSSILGLIGLPNQAGYCASKFAVLGYSESLRLEMADHNIAVTVVHPGGVTTRIAERARIMQTEDAEALQKKLAEDFAQMTITSPEKAAEIILRAVEKQKAKCLVGPDAKVVDWTKRLTPVGYSGLINRMFKV
ncbi:MAG: SDR family NAD(P)-dependent oxidoreductase [Parvibaculales bacterium]